MVNPTGYTALDLIGFTDKGTYNASATYVKNDIVTYSGSKWKCKVDDTTGVTPTEGATWTVFIDLPSDMAEQMIAPIEESTSQHAYAIGDQLIYNDILYDVTAAIAVNDVLTVGTNIAAADKVTKQIKDVKDTSYNTSDSTESTIANDDYFPFYDASASAKKKSTWSNMLAKIKTALGIGDFKDVSITTPADGDLLQYNDTDNEWINTHDEISAIENVYASKNLCPIESRIINNFTFLPDKDGYMTCSTSSDNRLWSYALSNQFFKLKAGTYFIKAFEKTAYTTGYIGLQIIDSNGNSIFIATWATLLSTGQTFTLAADTDIGVEYKLGDGAYAFMIMDNRIKDRTYAPYAPTNRDCVGYAVNTKLGAHNFAVCTATTGQSLQGVTYAINTDKSINASWSSTPAGNAAFLYSSAGSTKLEAGVAYTLTGCPKGGAWSAGNYKWRVFILNSSSATIAEDIGNGASFTPTTTDTYTVYCAVAQHAGASGNLTFKPLIKLASDTDPTYAPHAMTNRELTENQVKRSRITLTSSNITAGNGKTFYISQNSLPSDFHKVLAIIPISVGPSGWGTAVPAIVTTVTPSEMSIYVRAYVTGDFAPIVDILYT